MSFAKPRLVASIALSAPSGSLRSETSTRLRSLSRAIQGLLSVAWPSTVHFSGYKSKHKSLAEDGPCTGSLRMPVGPAILGTHQQAAKSVGSTLKKVGAGWQQVL